MIHLFLLAGMPRALEQEINDASRKRVSGAGGFLLIVPLPNQHQRPVYTPVYRHELLKRCHNWVSLRDRDDPFSVSLLYASTEPSDEERLLNDFFPFTIARAYKPLPVPRTGNERRRVITDFVQEAQAICSSLRSKAKVIHDHLTSRARRTPLLLPIVNFRSAELRKVLQELQRTAATAENLEKLLKDKIDAIDGVVAQRRPNGAPRAYYCNGDNLLFVPPGNHQLHGMAHPEVAGQNHRLTCYLSGRSRLGGSYNPRFHYDCRPTRGTLKSSYISCHGQATRPHASSHVNIAPNDFVR